MLKLIDVDYRRYSKAKGNFLRYLAKFYSHPGFRAVTLYRCGAWLRRRKRYRLAGIVQRWMLRSCFCDISCSAEIGAGLLITHTIGLVIGGGTRLGKNCDVRQNVTLGGNFSKTDEHGRTQPWVGDNVSVGAGAVVIGPIRVGSNAVIGANSVVTRDVPENAIVSGIPAEVIKQRWSEDTGRRL